MSLIITAIAALGVPERFQRLAAWAALAALLCALLATAKCTYDRNLIARHDAAQTIAVQATASAAADAAANTVTARQNEVEQTNDQARRAAAGSEDPLRAGFDQLRAQQAADRAAAGRPDPVRR